MRKPFEQNVFNLTDAPAREAGKFLLDNLFPNISTIDNPDKYGIDLLLTSKDDPKVLMGAAEVEVKLVWKGSFNYQTLHFPERKKKFIKGSTYFIIFNKDLTECFLVPGFDVLASPLVEVSNYKIKSGEKFFDVPITKCLHYKLSDFLPQHTA